MYLETALPIIDNVLDKSKGAKKGVEEKLQSSLLTDDMKSKFAKFLESRPRAFLLPPTTPSTARTPVDFEKARFEQSAASTSTRSSSNEESPSRSRSRSSPRSPPMSQPTTKSNSPSSDINYSSYIRTGRWLLRRSRSSRGNDHQTRNTYNPTNNEPSTTETTATQAETSVFNPLLCSSSTICISDKVVLTALLCGTFGLQCTAPDITFP